MGQRIIIALNASLWSLALAAMAGAMGGLAAIAVDEARDRRLAASIADAIEDRQQADLLTAKSLVRFVDGLDQVGAALAAMDASYRATEGLHGQRSYPGGINPDRGYPPVPAR